MATKFGGVQVFSSGLNSGYMGAGVAIVINNSLAKHVCKVSEAVEINSLIAKAVNESSFVILGGDFNKDGSHRCASFKKCFDLGLVNSLGGSSFVKTPTWYNSHGVEKTINFVFIFSNLVNAVVDCSMTDVLEHFDTDHKAVTVSVGLEGLLDVHLSSLHKQAVSAANATVLLDAFDVAQKFSDLDRLWNIIRKTMIFSADVSFKKKWFKDYDSVFIKVFSWFYKLELLVSKLDRLDLMGASEVKSLFLSGSNFDVVRFVLAKIRKFYHSSKLLKSQWAEKSCIKQAVDNRMESFELDKGCTIRNVLEHPFCKVVLNHLIMDNELILEPKLVKSKLLDYVFDGTFSDVMCMIGFNEMLAVVLNLPNEKAAGFSGISNELWKHCDNVLTNTHPIALIETAHKILFKILSDRIFSACSKFNVLRGDNFSVLKGTTTQSPIFAIGFVVKNTLEKNRELWLVLQNIHKAYDSVDWIYLRRSLVRIKMCDRFIRFFGGIHNGHINRVMTDFGLTNEYHVYDGLD
ncbi:hypothetical protein G9A89_010145 [Geosiphon pyriformis]|nr:hypothetical protein G9A89_010145 [Geosiphon pyriformis]